MLLQTVERLDKLVPLENVLIITHAAQRSQICELCPQLNPQNIIGEPVGCDTAAAVGLAKILVERKSSSGVFAILPADHIIHDKEAFVQTVTTAFLAAEEKTAPLVTIGIKPKDPSTAYGYICRESSSRFLNGQVFYPVKKFVEKPDQETAKQYVASGEYFWNAGMFVWQAKAIDEELAKQTPHLYASLQAMQKELSRGHALQEVLAKHYPNLEKISIDYAVMEKAKRVVVVEATFDWDDVGEWPAVARHGKKDFFGNTTRGRTFVKQGNENIVFSDDEHLIALFGLDDLIVVHTEDVTLVCPKSKAQEIKELVRDIAANLELKEFV